MPDLTEQPKCKRCGDVLDQRFIETIQKRRAELGLTPSVPKLCVLCVFKALQEIEDA